MRFLSRAMVWWLRALAVGLASTLLAAVLTSCSPSEQSGAGETTASPEQGEPALMADYIGGAYESALADLSRFNVQVSRRDEISSQSPGTVIAQSPGVGEDFSQNVELTVSISAPVVPDVVGEFFGDASRRLEDAGFAVVEIPTIDEGHVDGFVVSQDPPAGAANAGEVRLTVARRPVEVFLDELDAVPGSFGRTGSFSTDGESYPHSIAIESGYGSGVTREREYNLSRDYRRLIGRVGLDDEAETSTTYTVEIVGDGRALLRQEVRFGETVPVDLDVTDVLRLRLVVTRLEGDGTVIFAGLRAQGLESEVATEDGGGNPSSSEH